MRLQRFFTFPAVVSKSLQSKLMLLILLVVTIPLMGLGYFLFNQSSRTINEQFGKYGENSVYQLQFQIDSIVGRMKYTVDDLLSYLLDPNFTVLYEEIPKTYKGFQDEQKLEQFIKAHKTLETKGIYIITKSGYYYGDRNIMTDKLLEEPWYTDPSEKSDRYPLRIYEPQHYTKNSTIPGEKVIGLLFKIHNQTGILEDARILIEINADKLLDLFREFEMDTGAYLRITDQGRVRYETDKVGMKLEGTTASYVPHPDDVVWQNHSDETNWTIEVRIPHEHFYKSLNGIRTFTMMAVVISFLFAIILAYFISSSFIRRFKRMKESIHMVSIGKLDTRIQVDSDDEIGRLAQSFNSMVYQLQELIDEVKRVEQKKKEAELRAYHYQINPHLLINTLASIQWKARLQGAQDVNRMIHHLTMVLDENLNFTREIVTLEQELGVIDHFLKIQEFRYGHVFTYSIDAQEVNIAQVDIPRMTLQPLLENIFFHGFEDGQGNIELRMEKDGASVRILLIDNGKGMNEHKLRTLLDPSDSLKSKRRIGMFNVDQRIKLHFGAEYGLFVTSTVGVGTTITIRLPGGG
ncbi:histidine kinase [Paenibacillus sp. N1-5-1-14]|uniref:sensor histidine kinase n=1 Tax=Paenibacillus radicibacter TaxID=2972488 RepID=UPI002158F239|nr:sensor histidine kinase [Paenibacillus radicibacter]MCR8642506.1 histidine kinase [Paenibacillus radicibacter]